MAMRGFTRRLQRSGAWFERLALGDDGTAPVFPPLYIKPTSAPTTTAAKGDAYVDTNGVLQVHNGTNYVPGGGGNVVIHHVMDAAGNHITKDLFIADRAYQLVSAEEAHIRKILSTMGFNIAQAARALEIDRVTLYNQMRKFGIDRP